MLVDSRPLANVREGENLRFICRMYKNKLYGKFSGVSTGVNRYNSTEEIAVRNFLKGVLANPPKFNLQPSAFYDYNDIITFVKNYNPSLKISISSLSHFKHRNVKIMRLSKTKESDAFLNYVKLKFKDFDEKLFYKELP